MNTPFAVLAHHTPTEIRALAEEYKFILGDIGYAGYYEVANRIEQRGLGTYGEWCVEVQAEIDAGVDH